MVAQTDRPGHAVAVARTRAPKISPATSEPASPGFSCAYMNTISWRSPTTPLPMEINPRVVFERLFGEARQRRRTRAAHMPADAASSIRSPESRRPATRPGRRATAPASANTSTTSAKSSAASSRPKRKQHVAGDALDAPIGVPESFDEHVGLMFDLVARWPTRPTSRASSRSCCRASSASGRIRNRRHRAAPLRLASRQRPGQDREEREDQHVSRAALREVPREAARPRRTATARCSITR